MKRKSTRIGLSHLRVSVDSAFYMGPGRADLMTHIMQTGSISGAGKAMGMSYKRAWELIQNLNAGFGADLIVTERGGAKQGGAQLSAQGEQVLQLYRDMERQAESAIAENFAKLQKLVHRKEN